MGLSLANKFTVSELQAGVFMVAFMSSKADGLQNIMVCPM